MSGKVLVDEVEVIIAVAKWLHDGGKRVMSVSVPNNKGPTGLTKKMRLDRIEREFSEHGIKVDDFPPHGADIVASSDYPLELWMIECKGSGTGVSSTQATNFARLLSSVVSHYGWVREDNRTLRLGMALPSSDRIFLELTKKKVSGGLQDALNLTILFYEPDSGCIVEIE